MNDQEKLEYYEALLDYYEALLDYLYDMVPCLDSLIEQFDERYGNGQE